ncbi:MAG: hypothetical protein HW391_1746 [Chloroflexi bacterium]|nr:hypothetical protein [Chloroflexota bacterium]
MTRRAWRDGDWAGQFDASGRLQAHRSVDDLADPAVGVDEELRRQREDAIGPEDDRTDIAPDRVAEVVLPGVLAPVLDGLLDLDADEGEAAIAVLLVQLPENRRLGLAGRTPAGPEVDPDDAATEIGQPKRRSVQIGQGERRTIVERSGQLRGEVADTEARERRPEQIRRGGGVGKAGVRGSEGSGRDGKPDGRDDHDAERGRDLAEAERTDATAAPRCCVPRRRLIFHCGNRQIAELNGTNRGRSASQSMTIATPTRATSTPPTMDTVRPCRSRGRITAGARS